MAFTTEIPNYNNSLTKAKKAICMLLAQEINNCLPMAESKVWHGAPVWFIDGNPVVGYWARKDNVQLLFWSGQSFEEMGLKHEGKFKAAEARYDSIGDVGLGDLHRWLKKSAEIQWDYKNIVKRRGELVRLK